MDDVQEAMARVLVKLAEVLFDIHNEVAPGNYDTRKALYMAGRDLEQIVAKRAE